MLNKVVIMGRLTANPELRQTANGVSTCRFTVACDRNYVGQGQDRQADFITVVAWRQTAEFVSRYFSKGRLICIEGTLRSSSYDDKRHPEVKHYVTEVYADQVYFTGEKASDSNGQANYSQRQQYSKQYQTPTPPSNYETGGIDAFYEGSQTPPNAPISVGDLGDFEEVIGTGDSDLPF
ncbi:MAG: single-stranded DNA-binding protein [Oscillospiraceae bacterium]|nr:single-stranded DNA-binding protein [Oscillospiraceae bacterium]